MSKKSKKEYVVDKKQGPSNEKEWETETIKSLKKDGYKLVLKDYTDKYIPMHIWAKSQGEGLGVEYYFTTKGCIVGNKRMVCRKQLELFNSLYKVLI